MKCLFYIAIFLTNAGWAAAADLCEPKYRTSAVAESPFYERVAESFESLPPEQRKLLEDQFRRTAAAFYSEPLGTEKVLGVYPLVIQRIRDAILKDPQGAFAQGLRRLGFKIEDGKITPPDSLVDLFVNHAKIVDGWIAEGLLLPEEAQYISLPVVNSATGKVEFIIPGIDPWPAKFDLPTKLDQFNHQQFYEPVARNAYPLVIGDFMQHDLGHITSKGDHPAIMRETTRYARGLAAARGGKPPPTEPDPVEFWPTTGGKKSENRSWVLEEWLFLPDVENPAKKAKIEKLVQHLPDKKDLSVEDVRKQLEALPNREAHLRKFFAGRPLELLVASGGGARDGFSTAGFNRSNYGDRALLSYLADRMGAPKKEYPQDVRHSTVVVRESLHGVIRELGLLYQLRYQWKDTYPSIAKKLDENKIDRRNFESLTEDARNKVLDELILQNASRAELLFKRGLDTGITPQQVYADARVDAPPTDSPTFKYLQGAYGPGTLYHDAFELGRAR